MKALTGSYTDVPAGHTHIRDCGKGLCIRMTISLPILSSRLCSTIRWSFHGSGERSLYGDCRCVLCPSSVQIHVSVLTMHTIQAG